MASTRAHAPTARKLARARDAGDVARSTELALAVVVAAAWLAWTTALPALARALEALLYASVQTQGSAPLRSLESALAAVAIASTPLLLAPALAALAVVFVQGGFVLTGRAAAQRGALSVLDTALSWFKASVLGAVLLGTLWRARPGLFDAWQHELADVAAFGFELVGALLARAAGVLLVLGIADYAYQALRRARRLRMTRSELQDERRATEGDPHLHAERRRRAREAAMQAGVMELSRATLVVHDGAECAVALRFAAAEHAAPRVWIKADAEHARRLCHSASERGLLVQLDGPLTAALAQLEVNQPIPSAYYGRVAQWLAGGAPHP